MAILVCWSGKISIGIYPLPDFAYEKIFGSPKRQSVLISRLNSILQLDFPITDVVILYPFSDEDFEEDKLTRLDLQATDDRQRVFNIEVQLSTGLDLTKRLRFYTCELFADPLRNADDYNSLEPVFATCLYDGVVGPTDPTVHRRFQLTERVSDIVLRDTSEIHTIELAKYNVGDHESVTANSMERRLFWLLHSQAYTRKQLDDLFPDSAFRSAKLALDSIGRMTMDKQIYDARRKAPLDRKWLLDSARKQGLQEGRADGPEIGLQERRQEGREEGRLEGRVAGEWIDAIKTLQELLSVNDYDTARLASHSIDELRKIADILRQRLRNR